MLRGRKHLKGVTTTTGERTSVQMEGPGEMIAPVVSESQWAMAMPMTMPMTMPMPMTMETLQSLASQFSDEPWTYPGSEMIGSPNIEHNSEE